VVERVERVFGSDTELELDTCGDLDEPQCEYVVDLPPEQRHLDTARGSVGELEGLRRIDCLHVRDHRVPPRLPRRRLDALGDVDEGGVKSRAGRR
jgi:hypothetical protein